MQKLRQNVCRLAFKMLLDDKKLLFCSIEMLADFEIGGVLFWNADIKFNKFVNLTVSFGKDAYKKE